MRPWADQEGRPDSKGETALMSNTPDTQAASET